MADTTPVSSLYKAGPKQPNLQAIAAAAAAGIPANQVMSHDDMNALDENLRDALARIGTLEALLSQQAPPTLISYDPVSGLTQIRLDPGQTPDMLLVRPLELVTT